MVIMVIALVIVALAGPAAGYFFARRKFGSMAELAESRIRDLEEEGRRFRTGVGWGNAEQAPRGSALPPPPAMPGAQSAPRRAASGPGHQGPAYAHSAAPQSQTPARQMPPSQSQQPHQAHPHAQSTGGPPRSAAERFSQEPPLFGGSGAGTGPEQGRGQAATASPPQTSQPPPPQQPTPQQQPQQPQSQSQSQPQAQPQPQAQSQPQAQQPTQVPPAQQSTQRQHPQPAPPKTRDDAGTPGPAQRREASSRQAPPRPESPARRTFTPVSDLIDESDAQQLDWLGDLNTGRRVRLQKLGYDAPEKLANLRRSEIRRLARELDVSETVILDKWMPAAVKELRRRGKA